MSSKLLPFSALLVLTACNGAALVGPAGGDGGTDPGDSIVDLPGEEERDGSVTRYEAFNAETGSGYAEGIEVVTNPDGSTTFFVDNLAFDGGDGNGYREGTAVASIGRTGVNAGPFTVYEGPNSVPDIGDGDPIGQFLHRAIYAESANTNPDGSPRTRFAIVRTGAYVDYGFGGFLYERNGSVVLPTAAEIASEPDFQANFTGDYASLVDYNGRGGVHYGTGNMEVAIDFQDFNDGAGVYGYVTNRQYFDINGNNVTGAYLTALSDDLGYDIGSGEGLTGVPALVFTVGPGVLDADGELQGQLTSTAVNSDGIAELYESGTYYAVLSGDVTNDTGEVAGIIVVTSDDPGGADERRETGGFIVYQ